MFGGMPFEDPYYGMNQIHHQHMQRMNEMMANPFGAMNMSPLMMPMPAMPGMLALQGMPLTAGQGRDRDYQRRGERQLARRQPDCIPFADPFAHISQMMGSMRSMMGNMHAVSPHQHPMAAVSDPNGQFYSQSSFMSYSNTGDGAPHVYQSSSSTRQAPGGVKETRKSVRDSRAGIEKMAIGHHINDRAHVVTRSRNHHTEENEEEQDYINLDEEEADTFNQEWREKAHTFQGRPRHQRGGQSQIQDRPRHHTPAIDYQTDPK